MSCANCFDSCRFNRQTGEVFVTVNGNEMALRSAMSAHSSSGLPGFYWSWTYYDDGCLCLRCLQMHDAYAELSVAANYPYYNPSRTAALAKLGWNGTSCTKMADGWPKPGMAYIVSEGSMPKYPQTESGYVCKKCNMHNEYAGPEHLKNGIYICYNCK